MVRCRALLGARQRIGTREKAVAAIKIPVMTVEVRFPSTSFTGTIADRVSAALASAIHQLPRFTLRAGATVKLAGKTALPKTRLA